MKNLSIGLLVAFATTALSGCALYFGNDHDNDDTWTYCGSDGYYTCDGDNCQWVSSTCPDQGSGGGGQGGGGFECTDSTDCAAGCYCANGVCEEAGFCTQDSDCGTGYVCNEERSSCEPAGGGCTADANCPSGQTCNNGTCTATCTCSTDAEAAAQGYDYCDELRITCMSGTDPAGTCAGEPTCNQLPPTCQPGDVPLLGADGCWNGECEAASQCADAPACSHIKDEATCLAQPGCSETVNGINCKKSDGTACQAGDTGCTCDSYVFASCH
jgi:Cys-rich repeat protein